MTKTPRIPKARIIAPAGEPPPAPPETPNDDPPADDTPDLSEIGDMIELADAAYIGWKWWVYRVKSADEMRKSPRSQTRAIVTRITGPLDVLEIQKQYGGGIYEFWGFQEGTLRLKRVFEIEGPRKSWDEPATVTVPVTPSPNPTSNRTDQLLEQLIALHTKAATPTPAPSLTEQMTAMVQMAKMLQPAAPPSPENLITSYLALFQQGVEIGTKREPGEGGTNWAEIIEKGSPLVEKIVGAMVAGKRAGARPQPPRPAPRPAQPGGEVSAAEVLETAATDEPAENVRMTAVIDGLARAVACLGTDDERPPDDFAATVETILLPSESALLRIGTTDQLMSELERVATQFPVFAPGNNQAARQYVDAVLAALRDPGVD